jgi:hypothetical protein
VQPTLAALRALYERLSLVAEYYSERLTHEHNVNVWMHICYRMDVIALISFNAVNCYIFASYAFQFGEVF